MEMAGASRRLRIWAAVSLLTVLQSGGGHGFYLPESYPQRHKVNESIYAKVNSITSVITGVPYGYYSLPFCQPEDGVHDSVENLGELLMGDRIEDSPYRFQMLTDASKIVLCRTGSLSSDDFALLRKRIDEMYQVNLILDNLPAIRYAQLEGFSVHWTGYPIGIHDGDYYVFNHLKFRVLVNKYEDNAAVGVIGAGEAGGAILAGAAAGDSDGDGDGAAGYVVVGFDVVPCNVEHDPEAVKGLKMYDTYPGEIQCDPSKLVMGVREKQSLVFTYEVEFVQSDIRWPSRWDAYLKMDDAKVHWFSILSSLVVIFFLAGVVLAILMPTLRRDLVKYGELDKEQQAQMNEELSGWKLVVGDVFRVPSNPSLLCIMIGDGVQILGMALVTIFFAAMGFMSPASRGNLTIGMLFFYLVLGIAAGYAAARLWKTLRSGDHSGWVSISWGVACFFPGFAFLILTAMNFLLWGSHSTGAIPFSVFLLLFLLWFSISVPLTLFGGFLGSRAPHVAFPVRTNQIPREVPPQKYSSWLLVLAAGTLPFATLYVELFFIVNSIWFAWVYYVFGFLLVVVILLVVVCAEVSLVLTYTHLCVEEWRWWWKAFFSSGSVAIYTFLYSVSYLIFQQNRLREPVSVALLLGYSFLMAFALMLATGTVGLLSSFWFVHYLFSSVKIG